MHAVQEKGRRQGRRAYITFFFQPKASGKDTGPWPAPGFLPQLTFLDGARAQQNLWTRSEAKQRGLQVDITPTMAGLKGMHEDHISFPPWSNAAAFCPAHLQHLTFDQLSQKLE